MHMVEIHFGIFEQRRFPVDSFGLFQIDVSPIFADLVHQINQVIVSDVYQLDSLQYNITGLSISSNSCNNCEKLDLNGFRLLTTIEIGNNCFESVKTFQINGLNQLKTIKIGNNSFTQKKKSYGNDASKSFQILFCKLLESLEIGEYSFSDFAGYFQLGSLSSLRSIKIGSANAFSYCFYGSTFAIRGMLSF